MNRSGAPWMLCMIYVCYILNHISHEALDGQIPLSILYGVSSDVIITLLQTCYKPVYYAPHNQSFPSSSEEQAVFSVGFGNHIGDAITHKL